LKYKGYWNRFAASAASLFSAFLQLEWRPFNNFAANSRKQNFFHAIFIP